MTKKWQGLPHDDWQSGQIEKVYDNIKLPRGRGNCDHRLFFVKDEPF